MGIGRRLTAVLYAILAVGAIADTGHGQTVLSRSDIVYLQAQPWAITQVPQSVPVVRSPSIRDGSENGVNDIWPRLVQFQPQTDYVEPFIQSDLAHGVQYNYHFTFELHARNGQGRGIAAPDGWYQMQLAVIRKSRDSIFSETPIVEDPYARYVTSTSAIVKISGGSFARKISLRFPLVTDVAVKHHLFVELIPLDNNCQQARPDRTTTNYPCIRTTPEGAADILKSELRPLQNYRPYLIEMPFVPAVTSGSKVSDTNDVLPEDLPYRDQTLADYISRSQLHQGAQRIRNAQVPTSPRKYARDNHLHYITPDDPFWDEIGRRWAVRGGPTYKQMFEELLRKRSVGPIKLEERFYSLFPMLCEGLLAKNAHYHQMMQQPWMFNAPYGDVFALIQMCQLQPQANFRVTRVTHIGRPLGQEVKRISQRGLNYNIMSNFALNRSTSVDTFTPFSFKPASILFNFISSFGLNLGFVDIGVTNSYGNSRSTSGTGIASMGQMLDFSYHVLNVPTLNSQQCLEIRPIARSGFPFYDFTEGVKNGFYVCDTPQAQLDVPETFAHVFVRCTNSAILDCYDPLSQDINFGLRGEREITAFLYAARGMISAEGDNRLTSFQDVDGAEAFFQHTSITGHMRAITPIEFPREGVPSFLARLLYMYQERFD